MMELQKHIDYWLKSAAHDLETAEVLFEKNRYDWCLFLGHLVIEKMLKAFFVRDNQNQTPPFTHNLSMIAASTNLNLIPEQEELLLALNQFNIRTRYPDYKLKFYKKCTHEFTMPYFTKIKEFYEWLLQQI
jgi:HEPN domain-containing protein